MFKIDRLLKLTDSAIFVFVASVIGCIALISFGYLMARYPNVEVAPDNLSELFSHLGSFMAGIGTLSLVALGYNGIDSWKKQFTHEKRFTLLSSLQDQAYKTSNYNTSSLSELKKLFYECEHTHRNGEDFYQDKNNQTTGAYVKTLVLAILKNAKDLEEKYLDVCVFLQDEERQSLKRKIDSLTNKTFLCVSLIQKRVNIELIEMVDDSLTSLIDNLTSKITHLKRK